jgi:cyanophycin synthetase
VVAHRRGGARGGRAVYLRDGQPVLATANAETRLASLTGPARGGMGDESLLAVIAAAWALDIPPELIVAGIETFDTHNAPSAQPA